VTAVVAELDKIAMDGQVVFARVDGIRIHRDRVINLLN
jgi:hypothetical protein